MILSEIKSIQGDPILPFPIRQRSKRWQKLIVNHWLAIKLEFVSSHYDKSADISIFDPAGNEIGFLCFTAHLGSVEMNMLTEQKYIAYLNEIDFNSFPGNHTFEYDYLIIHDSFYQSFKNSFENTSIIWGGFKTVGGSSAASSNYISAVQSQRIDIIDHLNAPDNLSLETFLKALRQPFGFERFLKYYHVLELNFDNKLVQEIKLLNISTDAQKIGVLLNDYTRNDLDRLNYILNSAINDYRKIEIILNKISSYMANAETIFYTFGKLSNPIREHHKLITIIGSGGFTEGNCRAVGLGNPDYNNFLCKVASYWIYRIRCSIAHNKIGEYLMVDSDEEFVVEFGEPLLKEILKQYYT